MAAPPIPFSFPVTVLNNQSTHNGLLHHPLPLGLAASVAHLTPNLRVNQRFVIAQPHRRSSTSVVLNPFLSLFWRLGLLLLWLPAALILQFLLRFPASTRSQTSRLPIQQIFLLLSHRLQCPGRYWSTLARDVPFVGFMVTFYEAFKNMAQYGKHKLSPNLDFHINSSFEGLLLGGVAGGLSAYLITPLDVVKTRLQVQGTSIRGVLKCSFSTGSCPISFAIHPH